jgi:hypothetical protein
MFGAGALLRPGFRPIVLAGLLSGLEVMSTMSALLGMSARLLGKWYMLAVLTAWREVVVVVVVRQALLAGELSRSGELSRRDRLVLVVGERGAAACAFGFCWLVKSSVMVLPECFRFSEPGVEDIGPREGRSCG